MATHADVRRIALSLAETTESPDDFRFLVRGKQYLWLWQERVDPKKARVPNPDVLVARTGSDVDKQAMLRDVITQAWESRAHVSAAERARPRSRTGPRRGPASRRAR